MAIAYKSAGAGTSTETNGANLTPACPATVDAGDILIAHIVVLDATSALSTPDGWTPLFGPSGLGTGTPTGRAWTYGKIAVGTEDGAAINFGSLASTVGRLGRIYSFSGRVSGTITDLVPAASFAENSSEQDPEIQAVTTTVVGAKAVALVSQDDDNAHAGLGAVTGGTWVEAVADYIDTTVGAQGAKLQLQVGTPTSDPGTIAGGTVAGTNDEANTMCFEIRPSPGSEPHSGTLTATGGGVGATSGKKAASLAVTGTGGGSSAAPATSQRLATLTATGGGVITIDYLVEQGEEHSGALAGTGGGTAAFAATTARDGSLTATASGSATLQGEAGMQAALAATGGGTIEAVGTTGRGELLTATASGSMTFAAVTERGAALTATASGVMGFVQESGRLASLAATGGGAAAFAGTPIENHNGALAATGGGLAEFVAVTARLYALAATGGGAITIVTGDDADPRFPRTYFWDERGEMIVVLPPPDTPN